MRRFGWGVGVATVAAAAGWTLMGGIQPVAAQTDADQPAFYTQKVQPIFEANCGKCHLGTNHKGSLSLATRAAMLRGGRDGAVIVPGDPAKSLLVKLIRHEGPADDPMPMPPKAPKISDEDIATVEQWIKAGALMPDDPPPSAATPGPARP